MQLLSNDFAFNVRVISDLLSVSCATVARKNLIGWCKQRDFFSRRLGARFMSISKPCYQHSGTIYRRSKSYLIVRISSDTAAENYGQVWLQFAMTTRVLPRRPLAMLWHARGPEAATLDSWPEQCCWNRINWHPEFWSSFLNNHSLFRQTEAVVHCQIQQQTLTCCNAELSLSNHRYILLLELWVVKYIWQHLKGDYLVSIICTWKMWDFNLESILLIIEHEITPLFLLMFDIKYKKTTFFIKHFPHSTKRPARRCRYRVAARVAAKSTIPSNFQKLASLQHSELLRI